jgi:transposase
MDREERREAKALVLANLRRGQRWPAAAVHAGLWISERTTYRWAQRARLEGEEAVLEDGRHGHASKLRGPVRPWLADYCRATPTGTGQDAQAAVRARFGLVVSVSQINRVRAELGVGRRRRAVSGSGPSP